MSKFNQTNTMKTTNKCGHVAYDMKDVDKLVTQVLTHSSVSKNSMAIIVMI